MEGARRRTGKQIGEERPQLYADLERYWMAFMHLHASRSLGYNGAESISAQSIHAWLQVHMVCDIDARSRYYDFITVLDMTFMRWQRAKTAEEQDKRK